MNRTVALNFGPIGRCACGAIGRRRAPFMNEPICPKCLPLRSSYMQTIRDSISAERLVGQLTPAQRKARVEWLTGSLLREGHLLAQRDEIHASAGGSGS